MRVIVEVIVALLASFGLLVLAWLVVGQIRKNRALPPVYAVVAADGIEPAALQQVLQAVKWHQQWRTMTIQPVIACEQYNDLLMKMARQYDAELWLAEAEPEQ